MTRTSLLPVATIVLMGFTAFPIQPFAKATDDIRAKLSSDVVAEKDGTFTIDRLRICRLFRPKELGGGVTQPFQVKSHAEAPVNVISRDNFVALLAELAVNLRVSFAKGHIEGMTPLQALTALRCKLIEAPIGNVDFEVQVHMNKDGIQLEVTETASGHKNRQTQLWDQVFGQ